MPSIRTVADRAGVSTATVSNVLNLRRNVGPALAARVHAAVAELGYIADVNAARLRSRRSTVVGVLVPDIANPFFGGFVAELETASRADGYDLLVVSTGDDCDAEAARLRALMTWRPAGVIILPCDDALAARDVARTANVPIVAADRIPTGADFDAVAVDNRAAAADVARHLIDRGHRRILAIASDRAIANMADRCEGILRAASGRAEIEIIEVGLGKARCHDRIAARLAQGDLPSAIFALNNQVTLSALEALHAAGLRVGRDIALAGFDDEEWMQVVAPPLTAVRQPTKEMARAAWARLHARINGDLSPPREIRLACTLEIRASSALVIGREAPRAA